MGVVHNYMFCAFMVIVGIIFAQEIDSGTNREINLLKWRMDNVNMELLDVKADLKVEKAKTMKLEKQVNTLMEGNKKTKIDDTDSDLPGHVSVEDQQLVMDKVSSFIKQHVYPALNDEKMLRKQFQNQTQTDFKTEKEKMENKFTVLNETLSAVIETNLQTIVNKVRDSVIIINESISSIDNISRHVQQNSGGLTSLRVELDQLNTTLLEHGAQLRSLNDSLVVVQASVIELQNDSHQYKEDNSRTVQQHNEAINNLLAQSEYGKISLLRHDAALTSLNDTLVDIHASVVELWNDSRHYKEDNSRTVQQNNEAITNLLAQSEYGKISLLRHDAALTSLNDSFVDIHAYVIELRNDSRQYKEDNSRTVQQNNEAINNLLAQSEYGKISLLRHDAALASLNDTIVDMHTFVDELRNDSRQYKKDNSRTVQQNNEAITNLLAQSEYGKISLLRHDAALTSLNDTLVDIHANVVELRNDSRQYKEDNSRTVQQNNEAINNLLAQSEYGKISLLRHDAALASLNDTIVDMHTSVDELRNDSRQYKKDNSRTVQQNNDAINNLLAQSEYGKISLLRHKVALTSLNDTLVDMHTYVDELRNDSRHYKENNSRTVQQNNEAINNLLTLSQHGTATQLRHNAVLTALNDTLVDIHASVVELRNDSRHYKENNRRTVQQNTEAINNLLEQSQHGKSTLSRHDTVMLLLKDSLLDIQASVVELQRDSRQYKENNRRTVQQNTEAINSLLKQSQHGKSTLTRHDTVMLSLKDSLVDIHASVMELYKEQTKSYTDCYDIHKETGYPSGLYFVKPHGLNEIIRVMCDMDTDGGGWTVFQYRYDGSVDFYQNFRKYLNGFGSLSSEFWLGLSYIQAMAWVGTTQLRIDVQAADGTRRYQKYNNFYLTEGPDYALKIGTSTGTIGDTNGLSYNNGLPFSTHDHDRDDASGNCAEEHHGGWWYKWCGYVNLNGQYATPGTRSTLGRGYGGMVYYSFKKRESLKTSKIMFRRT